MGESLQGFHEYISKHYNLSIFEDIQENQSSLWEIHLHDRQIIVAAIKSCSSFDVSLTRSDNQLEVIIPKLHIKCLYPVEEAPAIRKLIKIDNKVRAKEMPPILTPSKRSHVKNKSLYPLMMDRTVVIFTLLEGEVFRGIISDFSRYEITINLKGGLPVTILRHAVLDLRDKKKRCYLKDFQKKHQDWKKSTYYIDT